MSPAPTPRVVLLVNPTSGKGRAAGKAAAVAARLRRHGLDVIEVRGRSVDDATEAVEAELAEPGPQVLVALGGDGTVHQALQLAVAHDVALGIVPAGSGNDGALALGVPTEHDAAADLVARMVADGRRRHVDVALAVTADGVERYFLAVLSSGFDSLVNERANRMRWPRGDARYVRAILAELRTFRPVPYRMVLDEGLESETVHEKRGMLVAVGNGSSYGGGMLVCPDARVDDGLLSLTFLDEMRTRTFLRVFPTVYKGTHVRRPEVHQHSASTVTLDAPGQLAYADGERIGPLPVQVTVLPAALPVLAPPTS